MRFAFRFPRNTICVMSDPIDGPETEIITYPYSMNGKPHKRLCVIKGNDIITIFMKTARSWEYSLMVSLYSQMSRGGSFVEVGANLGTDTVFASDFFKTCYAFEPASRHTAIFRKNLELNNITNIQLFPVAASDHCGTTRLYFGQDHNTGSAALQPNLPGMTRFEDVQMVTLDSALPDVTDVTFMHIDAEGHDVKVLQGAKNFISRQTQKPFIKMEFQPGTMSLHGSNIAELIGFLDEFKYKVLFNAMNYFVPLTHAMLIEMFYLWRPTHGWIDIYLAPA
jgi:FkbM family methyltransferase